MRCSRRRAGFAPLISIRGRELSLLFFFLWSVLGVQRGLPSPFLLITRYMLATRNGTGEGMLADQLRRLQQKPRIKRW